MKKRKRYWSLDGITLRVRPVSSFKFLSSLFLVVVIFWQVSLETCRAMLISPSQCLGQTMACNCSWKSGKFVADCNPGSLKEVPNNDYYDFLMANSGNNQMPTLNRDIQSLNLSSNLITVLNSAEFSEKKFRNLQRLYLASNKISRIHSNAFFKLTGLVELDLSANQLTSLAPMPINTNNNSSQSPSSRINVGMDTTTNASAPSSFLQYLGNLRQLNLASNKLTRIGPKAFVLLAQLRQLILSSNRISSIHPKAFEGLKLLNVLHLDENKLSSMNGDLMMQVPQLYSVRLGGPSNEWRCDCHLRPLLRRLVNFRSGAESPVQNGDSANSERNRGPKTPALSRARQPANASLAGSLTILDDEPQCRWLGSSRANPTGNQRTLTWANLTLAHFQCQPKLVPSQLHYIIESNRQTTEKNDQNNAPEPSRDHRDRDRNRDRDSSPEAPKNSDSKSSNSPSMNINRSGFTMTKSVGPIADGEQQEPDRENNSIGFGDTTSRNNQRESNHRDEGLMPITGFNNNEHRDRIAHRGNNGKTTTTSSNGMTTMINISNTDIDNNGRSRAGSYIEPLSRDRIISTSFRKQLATDPLELTCAIELTDELDLELTRVEWFVGFGKWPVARFKLLVNYSQPQTWSASKRTSMLNDGQVTLIDYVTTMDAPASDNYADGDLSLGSNTVIDYDRDINEHNNISMSEQAEPFNSRAKNSNNNVQKGPNEAEPNLTGNEADNNVYHNEDVNDKNSAGAKSTSSKFVRIIHLILDDPSAIGSSLLQREGEEEERRDLGARWNKRQSMLARSRGGDATGREDEEEDFEDKLQLKDETTAGSGSSSSENDPRQRHQSHLLFLCRVTNLVGQSDLVETIKFKTKSSASSDDDADSDVGGGDSAEQELDSDLNEATAIQPQDSDSISSSISRTSENRSNDNVTTSIRDGIDHDYGDSSPPRVLATYKKQLERELELSQSVSMDKANNSSTSTEHPKAAAAKSTLERAKLALSRELDSEWQGEWEFHQGEFVASGSPRTDGAAIQANNNSDGHVALFIPIELPSWILQVEHQDEQQQQQNQQQQHHQQPRPTIRQTNGTTTTTTPTTGPLRHQNQYEYQQASRLAGTSHKLQLQLHRDQQQQQQQPSGERQLRYRRLRPLAWSLIAENTRILDQYPRQDQRSSSPLLLISRPSSYINTNNNNNNNMPLPIGQAHQRKSANNHHHNNNLSARRASNPSLNPYPNPNANPTQGISHLWGMNSIWLNLKRFYRRHMDRYVQFAIGHVLLALLACLTLLLATLLTVSALFLMSRRARRNKPPNKMEGSSAAPDDEGHESSRKGSPPSLLNRQQANNVANNRLKESRNSNINDIESKLGDGATKDCSPAARYSRDVSFSSSAVSAENRAGRSSSISSISELMMQAGASLRPSSPQQNKSPQPQIMANHGHTRTISSSVLVAADELKLQPSTNESDHKLIKQKRSASGYHGHCRNGTTRFEDDADDDNCQSDAYSSNTNYGQQQRFASTLQRPTIGTKSKRHDTYSYNGSFTLSKAATSNGNRCLKSIRYNPEPEVIMLNHSDQDQNENKIMTISPVDGHIDCGQNNLYFHAPNCGGSVAPSFHSSSASESNNQLDTNWDNHLALAAIYGNQRPDTNSSSLIDGSHLVLVEPPESKYFTTILQHQADHNNQATQRSVSHQSGNNYMSLNRGYRIHPHPGDEIDMTLTHDYATNPTSFIPQQRLYNHNNNNILHSASLTSPAASSSTSTGTNSQMQLVANRVNHLNYAPSTSSNNNNNNLTPQNSVYIDGALHFLHTAMNECLPPD